ncbi:MAG: Xaa-Pro peptidase family protein [candidate division WOR-3 bacterium]
MTSRIVRLQKLLAQERLDGLVVSGLSNIRYLCGFTGSNGMMVITRNRAWFYSDFRYKEQMKSEVHGCRKRMLKRDLYLEFPVKDIKGVRRLGLESSNLTLERYQSLRRQLRGVRLVPVRDLVLELRRTKEPAEVQLIKRAQRWTDRVFQRLLELVKPGVSEHDLALEIEFEFRRLAEPAFPPIVASGPNAAKPHARFSRRKLRRGDVLTVDFGCRVAGYCSDMTRTIFLGRANPKLREVYEHVLEAQKRALASIRPGVACAQIDAVARNYLASVGLGKFFGHSLGHGVGIDVHELPRLAKNSSDFLKPGDVVTVEPGVYLPGLGGVRIEDMVLVTETGCENLTHSPKQLLEV